MGAAVETSLAAPKRLEMLGRILGNGDNISVPFKDADFILDRDSLAGSFTLMVNGKGDFDSRNSSRAYMFFFSSDGNLSHYLGLPDRCSVREATDRVNKFIIAASKQANSTLLGA
jgi:hypothetical protein